MVSLKDKYNLFIGQCGLTPTDNQMLKVNHVIIKDKQKDIELTANTTFVNCYNSKSYPSELPDNLYTLMGIKSISMFDVIEEYGIYGGKYDDDIYSAKLYIRINTISGMVEKIALDSERDIEVIALNFDYTLYSFNDVHHRIKAMIDELPPSLIQDIVHEFGEIGGVKTYISLPYRNIEYNPDMYIYSVRLGDGNVSPFLDLSRRPVPFDLFGLAMLGENVSLDKLKKKK